MNHFENNMYDGIGRVDAIDVLTELTSIACTNALMVAEGKAEEGEKDAACMWAIIGLCEGVLAWMPAEVAERGFEIANEEINAEKRKRAEDEREERAVKAFCKLVLGKEA